MLPKALPDKEDQAKKEKLMVELYWKWEPFIMHIFPKNGVRIRPYI